MSDEDCMRLALQEAQKGNGRTSPNPAVGAVIVRDGQLLASGWHRRAGAAHAEIEAVRRLKVPAKGATIFVTLEPCSTHGRTPPCVAAIMREGFARVVVGATDPNPAHAGRGLDLLRDAGIAVTAGVLEKECRDLNEGFNHWIVTGEPWVIAKSAMSLDGRISRQPCASQWLTSALARRRAHEIRAGVDAILVGAETVRRDDPHLTVRGLGRRAALRQPWRVIVSRSGDLPKGCVLLKDEWKERTLVFDSLEEALTNLGHRQATSVLIEGGGEVLGSAFDAGLVHRVAFFQAPMLVGGDKAAISGNGGHQLVLKEVRYEKLGPDLFCSALVASNSGKIIE